MKRFFKHIMFVSMLVFAGQICVADSEQSEQKYSFLSQAYNQLTSRLPLSYKLLAGAGAALGFGYFLYRMHLWTKPQTVVELMKAFNGYRTDDKNDRFSDGAIQKDLKLIAVCEKQPEKVEKLLKQKNRHQAHCAVAAVDLSQVDELSDNNKRLISYHQKEAESRFWNLIRSMGPNGSYGPQAYDLGQTHAQIMGILEAHRYINAMKEESAQEYYSQFSNLTPELKEQIKKEAAAMQRILQQKRERLFGAPQVQGQEQAIAFPDLAWCPAKVRESMKESLLFYAHLIPQKEGVLTPLGMAHGRILGLMQGVIQEYGLEITIRDGIAVQKKSPKAKKSQKANQEIETPQWQEAKKNWHWYALAMAAPFIAKAVFNR